MADDYTETLNQLKAKLTADATGRTLYVGRCKRRRRYVANKIELKRGARLAAIIAVLPTYLPTP